MRVHFSTNALLDDALNESQDFGVSATQTNMDKGL